MSGRIFGRVAFAGRDSADRVRIPEKRRGSDSRHLGSPAWMSEIQNRRPLEEAAAVSDGLLIWEQLRSPVGSSVCCPRCSYFSVTDTL